MRVLKKGGRRGGTCIMKLVTKGDPEEEKPARKGGKALKGRKLARADLEGPLCRTGRERVRRGGNKMKPWPQKNLPKGKQGDKRSPIGKACVHLNSQWTRDSRPD